MYRLVLDSIIIAYLPGAPESLQSLQSDTLAPIITVVDGQTLLKFHV
jgi:hypothetical protein